MRLRHATAVGLGLCWCTAASAAGPEDWAALHSGRLFSSLDRDPAAAVAVYEAVIDHLDEDDPLRGDFLYWLGRAWLETGDGEQAVQILDQVDGRSPMSSLARDFRGRLELTRYPVRSLPMIIEASTRPHPLTPGWGSHSPDLEVVYQGLPHFSWPIAAESVRSDFLALGLVPGQGRLHSVVVDARSTEALLAVRIVVETWSGGTWVSPTQVLRPGVWTEVTASLDSLLPHRRVDTKLDPSQVGMVAIELVPVDPRAVSSQARLQIKKVALNGS